VIVFCEEARAVEVHVGIELVTTKIIDQAGETLRDMAVA
jgi:hypothetical protein